MLDGSKVQTFVWILFFYDVKIHFCNQEAADRARMMLAWDVSNGVQKFQASGVAFLSFPCH